MIDSEIHPGESASPTVPSCCPKCAAELAVLGVISGKAGSEYWVMQCTDCDALHLGIVKPAPLPHTA